MTTSSASTSTRHASQTYADVLLRGRWLLFARGAWLVVAVLVVVLFVVAVPVSYARLQTVCTTAACEHWELTPASIQAFHDAGISARFYAGYMLALELIFASVYVAVAATIFWRKSEEPLALLGAIALLTDGTGSTGTLGMPADAHPLWGLLAMCIRYIGSVSLAAFFALFPQGRFVPRWIRWVVVVWAVLELPHVFFYASAFNFQNWPTLLTLAVWFGVLGCLLSAQIYRYRRVSNTTQRQQTKWVVYAATVGTLGFLLMVVLVTLFPWLDRPGPPITFATGLGFYGFKLLYPVGIGIAILRYRLWDIDPIINRTLVYAALTACVVGIYVLVVAYLGTLFRTSGNVAVSLVATGVVAVLFQPLRDRLQRGVNRLMYGERDEPYAVVARLGQRLEATLAPDAVLPMIARTVQDALKLPYIAIALKHGDELEIAAAAGQPQADLQRLPLVYNAEPVGELLLAPRAPGEAFSPADQRLLALLAQQAGVAVHAVRLTTELRRLTSDLQHSRERLIATREEERRRLRRDLHDGLGPTLASLTMKLDAAQTVVVEDPPVGLALLAEVRSQLKETIGSVRRLVYALRPPVLDQFGLVAAIREHALHCQTDGLQIELDAPAHLPPLPAAVEVAAYYIAVEALTNVARHAHARHCAIRLSLDESLQLEVVDDGCGLPVYIRAGVGLQSMRERAAELGGSCVVEAVTPAGTRVRAMLPLS